ncbi:MAG TPA: hypothetical protein VFR67_30250 [Pilimelia sp.]|nr:hypothetical protein [Pilimelia sp.]
MLYTPEEIVAELDRLRVDRAETGPPGAVPVDGRTADALDTP